MSPTPPSPANPAASARRTGGYGAPQAKSSSPPRNARAERHNSPMSVQPLLQVEAAFFRRAMPDLILREGSMLAARVAERHGRHGIITLGGTPLLAELPDGVKTGDTLQLLVADTRGEKVVMRLIQDNPAEQAASSVNLTQPDGSQARLTVDEDGSQDGGG